MKFFFYMVFVEMIIVTFLGTCGKDKPVTEGNAETRGATVHDSTKGGGVMVDTVWTGETHINFKYNKAGLIKTC